ncbi:MAG TPA: SAM-dependent methyltransferase [Chloroflexi bacterium]|nr:SAM-dependent methyltransferase [Chloroflexota bacterium]HAL28840.1 SAM-dependent methyltransferase [Chloroflexota bacterium]
MLVLGMWLYAGFILLPLRVLATRRRAPPLGEGGLGAQFSPQTGGPTVILTARGQPADFDEGAADYDRCVGPFSGPIFSLALDAMAPYLRSGSRVLDVGCGPGAALRKVARLVARGEVVGVDLSLEMLRLADERARRAGLGNVALFQADAAELPLPFTGSFDVAYSCLVHHHFTQPLASAQGIAASLRPGGVYAAIDATGPRLTRLATPLARAVDPGWVRFWGRQALIDLLVAAGLERVSWTPLAPGIGMAIGTRGSGLAS